MPRIKIDIDASFFSAISEEEKAKITSILKSTDLLSNDGTLASGPSNVVDAQAVIADPQGFLDTIKKRLSFCKIGCNTAGAAAVAACTAGTAGAGLVACLVATEIALEACLDEC